MKDVTSSDPMSRIHEEIALAQDRFAGLLRSYLERHETTLEQYVRYLSFQYHLTRDVQRYFLQIAAHADLARRRPLRAFLTRFANEEELHYLVAGNDLSQLGLTPLPEPFDVTLWHAYFRSIVAERPFVRMGAACILENISGGVARPWVKQALTRDFLTRANTKFLVLHQHEALPHGDQILDAIAGAGLEEKHFDDIVEGAREGTVLYLRMAEWALVPSALASICDPISARFDAAEAERIRSFDMRELEEA